MLMTHRSRPI